MFSKKKIPSCVALRFSDLIFIVFEIVKSDLSRKITCSLLIGQSFVKRAADWPPNHVSPKQRVRRKKRTKNTKKT